MHRTAHTVAPTDERWPRGLKDLDAEKAPPQLRVAGVLPDPAQRCIAIVGTRYADEDACRFARDLAAAAVAHGVVVVSGGAFGIDCAAHEGALAAGGTTIAVLAGGLAELYPDLNVPLFHRIVAGGGAVVSGVPDDTGPVASRFLQRNGFIAAWASDVIVVQAPARSGALSTARHGKRVGRTRWSVPGAPWDPRAAGNLALLRDGARPCTHPRDIFPDVPKDTAPRKTRKSGSAHPGLDAETQRILGLLTATPRHVDELAAGVHLPARTVQVALLSLSLQGLAEERSPGRYVRVR